jgi:hypothetical protein
MAIIDKKNEAIQKVIVDSIREHLLTEQIELSDNEKARDFIDQIKEWLAAGVSLAQKSGNELLCKKLHISPRDYQNLVSLVGEPVEIDGIRVCIDPEIEYMGTVWADILLSNKDKSGDR